MSLHYIDMFILLLVKLAFIIYLGDQTEDGKKHFVYNVALQHYAVYFTTVKMEKKLAVGAAK